VGITIVEWLFVFYCIDRVRWGKMGSGVKWVVKLYGLKNQLFLIKFAVF